MVYSFSEKFVESMKSQVNIPSPNTVFEMDENDFSSQDSIIISSEFLSGSNPNGSPKSPNK